MEYAMSKRSYQLTELTSQNFNVLNSPVNWSASNLTYDANAKELKSFGIRIAYARGRGWSWHNESELIEEIADLNGYQNSAFKRHHSITRNLIRAYNQHYCSRPPEEERTWTIPTPQPNNPIADALDKVSELVVDADIDNEVTTTPIPALNDAIIDFIMKLTDTIDLFNQAIRKQL